MSVSSLSPTWNLLRISLAVVCGRMIDFRDDTVPQGEPDSARSRVSGSHPVFISVGPSRLNARPSESWIDYVLVSYRALTRTVAFQIPVNSTLVEHGQIFFLEQHYSFARVFILSLPSLFLRSAWDCASRRHPQ